MYAPIIALWLCFEYLQLTCAYAIFMSVDQKCTSLWRNLWKLLCMSVSNHYWPTILVLNNLCSCKVLSNVATRLFVTTDQWTHHKKGHATIPSQHKSVAVSHYQSFFCQSHQSLYQTGIVGQATNDQACLTLPGLRGGAEFPTCLPTALTVSESNLCEGSTPALSENWRSFAHYLWKHFMFGSSWPNS